MGQACCKPGEKTSTMPCVRKFGVDVMGKSPAIKLKFLANKQNVINMDKAWMKTFGGPVYKPVYGINDKKAMIKKGRPNNLYHEFNQMVPDVPNAGGFYTFENIRVDHQSLECCDIYILVQKVEDKEMLEKLKKHFNSHLGDGARNDGIHKVPDHYDPLKMVTKKTVLPKDNEYKKAVASTVNPKDLENPHKIVFLDEIKPMLTGYARIVRYNNKSINKYLAEDNMVESGKRVVKFRPENLELIDMTEGQFKNGEKNGYCRIINAEQEDQFCEAGFFVDDKPQGKYCKFDSKSEIIQEGIYDTDGKFQKFGISNFTADITPKDNELQRKSRHVVPDSLAAEKKAMKSRFAAYNTSKMQSQMYSQLGDQQYYHYQGEDHGMLDEVGHVADDVPAAQDFGAPVDNAPAEVAEAVADVGGGGGD